MKKLIFIDNDFKKNAEENLGYAYRQLKYNADLNIKHEDIALVSDFHLVQDKFEDQLFDTDNVIITWSMFTDNHFGSYGQLCDFMVHAGLAQVKNKIFIDCATYLRDTLERAIEHYNQSVFIIRCIETNFIIHYDENDSKFHRLRFDANSEDFLKNEDINLQKLINLQP